VSTEVVDATVSSSEPVRAGSSARRDMLRRRARLISTELQSAARASRLAQTQANRVFGGSGLARGLPLGVLARLPLSFFALALLPAIVIVAYLSVLAAPQYSSEARFTVRLGERSQLDTVASLTGLGSLTQIQDSSVVTDYIQSRALVEELERRIGLRAMFQRDDIDVVSRLWGDTMEDLVRYWRWHVRAGIEMPSGIIHFEVRAFSPEDARRIAALVVELSENLVNTMSARARRDLVDTAEAEVRRAEARLRAARATLREIRDDEGLIDPRRQAEGINTLIGTLRADRARLEQEISSLTRTLSPQAPQIGILRERLRAANESIATLEATLTDRRGGGAPQRTIARALTRFDEAETERQVAERQYTTAAAALERARVTAERQRTYLATFVTPVPAQESIYPRRFWYSVGGVIAAVLFWAAVMGIGGLLRRRVTT
jgi:capsular polysaccharide transport system permease protein